jgi:hypothetical protein
MNLDLLKTIDLAGFIDRHYGIRTNGHGAALCPFHEDGDPSLSVQQKNGIGLFHCHACGAKGTIIDFVMKKEALELPAAARRIMALEGIPEDPAPAAAKPKMGIVRVHSYTDEAGLELWQKVKIVDGSFRCRRPGPDDKWIYNLEGVRRVPYRLDKIMDAPAVVVTEGERDADTLAALGFPATSGPSGKDSWPDEITPIFAGKECRILYDVGQDEAARAVAAKLAPVAKTVAILTIPGKDPVKDREYDITDLIEAIEGEEAKRDAVYGILAAGQPFVPDPKPKAGPDPAMDIYEDQEPGQAPAPDAPMTVMLSDVEPRQVPWLWPGYIPLGRATLISGDPGSAKTWFLLNLAARLSKGEPWPDGTPGSDPAQTYYITVEDDLNDTIRPRIDSLGGDPAMIAVFNAETPIHLNLADPEGLKRLEAEIVRLGNVRLVVTDPIVDFGGKTNPNAGEEVRALLNPLIKLAAKHNFALVIIGHLNKAQTMSAIYRAGGSTSGWLGKCRASFMIFRDKDDKPLRHVIPIKANLARQDPPQLEFRIDRGRLDITVSAEDIDIDEQLNPEAGRKPRERDDAVKWLMDTFIGQDEVPASDIEAAALRAKISARTLDRAKKEAGIRSAKRKDDNGRDRWFWVKDAKCLTHPI